MVLGWARTGARAGVNARIGAGSSATGGGELIGMGVPGQFLIGVDCLGVPGSWGV